MTAGADFKPGQAVRIRAAMFAHGEVSEEWFPAIFVRRDQDGSPIVRVGQELRVLHPGVQVRE